MKTNKPANKNLDGSLGKQLLHSRQALHEAIFECTACRTNLGRYVQRVQPQWDAQKGRGSPRRWAMIVGQAPGRTERKHGSKRTRGGHSDDGLTAFIGTAGKRLREWLREADFTEDEISHDFWKTAVTKCYPGKRVRQDGKLAESDRVPRFDEVRLCERFLESEIALVCPKVIITLGTRAAGWFDPSSGTLEETVGKNSTWKVGNQRGVLIRLPHPSPNSRWLNDDKHKEQKDRALVLLREERRRAR